MGRRFPAGRPRTLALLLVAALTTACGGGRPNADGERTDPPPSAAEAEAETEAETAASGRPAPFAERVAERERMVRRQIADRNVDDPAVLRAMRAVPRHAFIPEELARSAYADRPLPIGHRQTISQPYIVAVMTQLAGLEPGDRVLEIGTGSGYQGAVLAEIVDEVYTIEIVEPLAARARATFDALGYDGIRTRTGDGYRGWPEAAPFDAIVVTAAPPEVPAPLIEQLAVGGRLVIPVGDAYQELRVLVRGPDGVTEETVFPVRFVPMTGEAQERR